MPFVERFDLHVHSVASDGLLSRLQLLQLATLSGLSGIAITDHDALPDIAPPAAPQPLQKIRVLTGTELSCEWEGQGIHLLGYGFDVGNEELRNACLKLQGERKRRIRFLADHLNSKGLRLPKERIEFILNRPSPGRLHLAREIVSMRNAGGVRAAFRQYLDIPLDCDPMQRLPMNVAIDMLHRAGGIAVLAHPRFHWSDTLLERLASLGLDGIESKFPRVTARDAKRLNQFVEQHGLIATAGLGLPWRSRRQLARTAIGGSRGYGLPRPTDCKVTGNHHVITVQDICELLERLYPLALAEDWDNVGLLAGDPKAQVCKIMTCLTLTPESAAEAIEQSVDLVITHHPIFFRAIKRLTAEGPTGFLHSVVRNGISVFSSHTAYDNAPNGINQQTATKLELQSVLPIRPKVTSSASIRQSMDAKDDSSDQVLQGSGRWGVLRAPVTLNRLAAMVKSALVAANVEFVGDSEKQCRTIAIACGAACEFLPDAARKGCDTLITGEARFHDLLHAQSLGVSLVLPGHFASERFAMETMAAHLREAFPTLTVWPSQLEVNPLRGFSV